MESLQDDDRADLEALMGPLEPVPGPGGSHADFSRPFGLSEEADRWVVSLQKPDEQVIAGPFEGQHEAYRWADENAEGCSYLVVPLNPPEDWPGARMPPESDPPEPETPLFDAL